MGPLETPRRALWTELVDLALREDVGPGDATGVATLPHGAPGSAHLEARERLVVAGLEVAAEVFARFEVVFEPHIGDGESARAGDVLARVRGDARSILTAERVALNFAQRMCGIASTTRRYVDAVAGTGARVLDTRKTLPGFRVLDKYAVRCGGGHNHRMGLYDGILIKDNHIAACGSVGAAVKAARERGSSHLRIRVEIESIAMAREAVETGADAILIDNQGPRATREIVEWVGGRVITEASGGITLDNIAEIARTGVDEISVGALTHSVRASDLALEWNTDSKN